MVLKLSRERKKNEIEREEEGEKSMVLKLSREIERGREGEEEKSLVLKIFRERGGIE